MTKTGDGRVKILLWIYLFIGFVLTTLKAFVIFNTEECKKYAGHPVLAIIEIAVLSLNVFIWPFNTTFRIER